MQTARQAARLAASGVQAERRRERVEREQRLRTLAVDMLTALGERNITIAATERRAGQALWVMIGAEGLPLAQSVPMVLPPRWRAAPALQVRWNEQ